MRYNSERVSDGLSIGILVVSAVFVFLRSYTFEPINDELVYRFVLGDGFGTEYYQQRVVSLSDAVNSQINQWYSHSGRFLVHLITQMFASVWGRTLFSICNGLIFFIAIYELWSMIRKRHSAHLVFFAVVICILFTYLVMQRHFRPIAVSLNYLWPVPLVLWFIPCLKSLYRSQSRSLVRVMGIMLLAFITCATQEVYIVPLCGTAAVMAAIALRHRNHSVNFTFRCVFAVMLIGGASVVFASGTLKRGGGLLESPLSVVAEGLKMLANTCMFWGAMAAIAVKWVKAGSWRAVVHICPFELCCLAWSAAFAVIAHTSYQSMIGVSLFSLLVILQIMADIMDTIRKPSVSRRLFCAAGVLMVIFVTHQTMLVAADFRALKVNREIIGNYIKSPDGITVYHPVVHNPLTAKLVQNFEESLSAGGKDAWLNYTVQLAYGCADKPITIVTEKQREILLNIHDHSELILPGDAGFYKIGSYSVLPVDSLNQFSDSLTVVYDRLGRSGLFGKLRVKGSGSYRVPVSSVNVINTRAGSFYILRDKRKQIITCVSTTAG